MSMKKLFEMSSRQNKNGKRKFKMVLYKIFPDSCVDEANQVGTEYNRNGITWLEEYCEQALPSISGMFLRCEFLNDERTEICGHGDTGIIDGEPTFENASTIGVFTKGYIDEIEIDGEMTKVCIGEGEIDAQCYHNFVVKLEEDASNGIFPNGSIEIMKTDENDSIVYKYGYKEFGRIPMEFKHSGYALLGVMPADDNARLLELNNKNKEECKMTTEEIKSLANEVATATTDCVSEINKCKEDCASKIAEMQSQIDAVIAEKNEILASSEAIKASLEAVQAELETKDAELSAKYKEYDELWGEKCALQKALDEAKARERVAEMEKAIEQFSDAEKSYAEKEIEAFKCNPEESEINSVVDAIYAGIGRTSKENDKIAEQNSSAKTEVEDIFSGIIEINSTSAEDCEIF